MCECKTAPQQRNLPATQQRNLPAMQNRSGNLLDTLTGGEDIPLDVSVHIDTRSLLLLMAGFFFAIFFALLLQHFLLKSN